MPASYGILTSTLGCGCVLITDTGLVSWADDGTRSTNHLTLLNFDEGGGDSLRPGIGHGIVSRR